MFRPSSHQLATVSECKSKSSYGRAHRRAVRLAVSSRAKSGSVMPFVAISIVFFLSMLGVAIDMMMDFQAVNQLEFAAQTAAFYGISLMTATDSTYNLQSAETRIQTAILQNTGLWNFAPDGPKNKQAVVPFAAGDIQFVPNPVEASNQNQEVFLEVTGRRTGPDALVQFFLPLLYVGFSQPKPPTSVSTMSPFRMVEVIGQPASRIGPGAPLNAQANTRVADLVGFATFPLALNYSQFQLYSQPGSSRTTSYTVDIVSTFTAAAQANHIQGGFVDVSPNPGGVTGYGSANTANTLQNLLQYFSGNQAQNTPPAAVERGSKLSLFSQANVGKAQVVTALTNVLKLKGAAYEYMLPVLQGSVVVGFARATLTAPTGNSPTVTMNLTLGDSVPCRNASSALGYSSNPSTLGVLMPAPLPGSVFMPRTANPLTNNVSARPQGVVLAPALSPRILPRPAAPPTH